MRALPHILCFLATVPFLAAAHVRADDAPSNDAVRQAVERSLPFLEAGGLAWMREKACITCHQLPSLVWSFNAASQHQLPVDAERVATWNQWTVDNGLKRAIYFKLTDDVAKQLKAAGIGDDDLKKLDALKNKNYVFEDDFRDALAKSLSPESLGKFGGIIVKFSAIGGQGGGGGGTNNQFTALLLSGAPAAVKDSADVRKKLVDGLVNAQNKDGAWNAAGQFLAQQRPKEESAEVVTLWTVIALAGVPEASAAAGASMTKAREWLKSAKPPVSVEASMLRAMLAQLDGDQAARQKLLDELLALQHADGGWGWLKGRTTSDPFTTGQVLYGLGYLGIDAEHRAVGKARQYLLDTQGVDGAWTISMKNISATTKTDTTAGDAVYTYWATSWAVIGLMESLP